MYFWVFLGERCISGALYSVNEAIREYGPAAIDTPDRSEPVTIRDDYGNLLVTFH